MTHFPAVHDTLPCCHFVISFGHCAYCRMINEQEMIYETGTCLSNSKYYNDLSSCIVSDMFYIYLYIYIYIYTHTLDMFFDTEVDPKRLVRYIYLHVALYY